LNLKRTKIISALDKIILFSLYGVAFFLPISKAIIGFFIYLSFACYLLKKVAQKQPIIPKTKLNFAILFYFTVCLLSIFLSANYKISFRSFLGKVLQNTVLFFVVVDTFNTKRRINIFLHILFLSSILIGIDGIYQYFTFKDFIRNRTDLYDHYMQRIHASFYTPNAFGCYLCIVLPFVISAFFTKLRFKLFRLAYFSLFILLFTCLLLTVSRGAWFAFISSMFFMGIWVRALGIFFFAVGIFIIATHSFYPQIIKSRIDNLFIFMDKGTDIDRRIIWQAGWKMFMQRPLLGLGLGTFMLSFPNFVIKTYPYSVPYAHNCYLQIAAELGIAGLAAFLSILAVFFYNGIRAINTHAQKTFLWYVLLAALAAILGYCVQMAVDTVFYSLDLGVLFWLVLGLGIAVMKQLELGSVSLS